MYIILFMMILMMIYCGVSTDTHTLQYLYTNIRPRITFPEFISVGLVDGEQFVYYDNNISEMILKTEWIQKINSSDPDYCKKETELIKDQQDRLNNTMTLINQSFNHQECHVLQLILSCQPTAPSMHFGYDGEDFFHLDVKDGTWTKDKHQAEVISKKWDPKYWKDYLENDCSDWLNKAVTYGNETLERKVRPRTSLFQKEVTSPEVVCHATGFFPKALNITWQKDGENVFEDVEISETLPNHDGSFQRRSALKVSAAELQKHKYTCVIQHSSLEEDLVLPVSERQILRGGESDGGRGRGGACISIILSVVICLVAVVLCLIFRRRLRTTLTSHPFQ